jgi:hypothetical protein
MFEWEARSEGHECTLNVVKRTEAEEANSAPSYPRPVDPAFPRSFPSHCVPFKAAESSSCVFAAKMDLHLLVESTCKVSPSRGGPRKQGMCRVVREAWLIIDFDVEEFVKASSPERQFHVQSWLELISTARDSISGSSPSIRIPQAFQYSRTDEQSSVSGNRPVQSAPKQR